MFDRRLTMVVLAVFASCAALRLAPYATPIRASSLAQDSQAIEFTDRTGLRLGTILSRDQDHTAFVPLSEISPWFVHAIVAAEDGRYYERGPVDMLALARAAYQTARDRKVVSGASTIPMQLARMTGGIPSTTWGKVVQIWTAWRIAAGMDRNEILEAYANRLPMGGNVYGVEAAARTYFGVPAGGLDLAQASLLAAIPNDPNGLDPYAHFNLLKARQQYVLDRMVADGYIAASAARTALTEDVAFAHRDQGIVAAPHFLFWLAGRVPPGTAHVRTTIDRSLQGFVEEQVRQVLRDLASRNVVDAAALVVDNHTGQVLAYVGSPDYFNRDIGGSNDGVQSLRQPGSALKPFLYEYALESRALHPNTILADVPVHYALPDDLVYSPTDYSNTYAGPVRVRIALADSLNVPAVKTLERVGVGPFLDRLHELGFDHLDKPADYYGLGLTLGGGEVSLWELAHAYVTLARDGDATPLVAVAPQSPAAGRSADAIGSPTAWELVTDILADAHARARAFGVISALGLPFPAAVKTGTSSDFRDTWTVGYTTDFTVAVWVGNFTGAPMRHVSGVAGAAPLWNRIMLHLYESREPQPFPPPQGLVLMPICSTTGLEPGPGCRAIVPEYLYPEDVAAYRSDRPPEALPHDYDQWLATQPVSDTGSTLRIVRPSDGSYFIVMPGDPDRRAGPSQRLGFEAAGTRVPVRWSLNGRTLGTSAPGERLFWTLIPGTYEVVAESGSRHDSVRFTVAAGRASGIRRGFSIGSGAP